MLKEAARMGILNRKDLPGSKTSSKFEGYLHENTNVSFFLSESPPGFGPPLHVHPYEEIFIVQAGTLTFTVGEDTLIASAGDIAIVPPNTPHKFVNTGDAIARHVDIHVSPRMIQTNLE
jgi:quercetin dioxygenase-like cupin family protein